MDFKFKVYANHAMVVKYKGKNKNVVIPEEYRGFTVTQICDKCFCESDIKTIVGKSIKIIGDDAFYKCESLTSIEFPVCEYVGKYAFRICTSLTDVSLPVCDRVGYNAFYNCTSLASVNLPACTSIDTGAFNNCTSLTSINLPACEFVGGSAFQSCTSLTDVSFPVCSYFGECAFYKCTKLVKEGKYKATNIDLTCRYVPHEMQYEIGKWYEEKESVIFRKGFRYVENFYDIFNYYWGRLGSDFRIFEVDAKEISDGREPDSTQVCKRIKLVKEITSYKEFF